MNLSIYYICMLFLLLSVIVSSRPPMQRLLINNHMWEVPNEPGWNEVIEDAESIRRLLHKCKSAAECHHIVKQLRDVFHRYSVARKYLESNSQDPDDLFRSIFKWG